MWLVIDQKEPSEADNSNLSLTSLGDATMANLHIKMLLLLQAIFVLLGSAEGKHLSPCFIKVLRPQNFDLTTLFRFGITIPVKIANVIAAKLIVSSWGFNPYLFS